MPWKVLKSVLSHLKVEEMAMFFFNILTKIKPWLLSGQEVQQPKIFSALIYCHVTRQGYFQLKFLLSKTALPFTGSKKQALAL